jgi:hypothetical protein
MLSYDNMLSYVGRRESINILIVEKVILLKVILLKVSNTITVWSVVDDVVKL